DRYSRRLTFGLGVGKLGPHLERRRAVGFGFEIDARARQIDTRHDLIGANSRDDFRRTAHGDVDYRGYRARILDTDDFDRASLEFHLGLPSENDHGDGYARRAEVAHS